MPDKVKMILFNGDHFYLHGDHSSGDTSLPNDQVVFGDPKFLNFINQQHLAPLLDTYKNFSKMRIEKWNSKNCDKLITQALDDTLHEWFRRSCNEVFQGADPEKIAIVN
jgi:hypothetical protein